MKLGLLNTLTDGRGGGINPDGLSLDLQFAADKTFSKPSSLAAGETAITSRRGPSATFLRSTAATEVGPDGLIRYAPENLIPQSQDFSSATWLKKDGVTAGSTVADPFGGNSAFTLIFSSAPYSRIEQNISSAIRSGDVATVSVYLRADSNTTIFTRLAAEPDATFNVTTSWQRFSYTGIVSPVGLYPQLNNAYSGAKTIYAYGFQVERHTSARAYIPTTTAAVYGPRFDHDPVTLACKGLLIEEGRTNLVFTSGFINPNSGWLFGNVTEAVSGTGPDGNNAYRISEDASTTNHFFGNTGGSSPYVGATPVVSGTNYTGSVFVKKVAGSVDWVQLTYGGAGFGVQFANFNISNGTVGNYANLTSGTVPRIQEFPNGWYRISMTATAISTVSTINVCLAFINNTDFNGRLPSYLGTTSNQVLASLFQFEAGSFPTSYIPTTTGTLARGADVCSITTAGWSNAGNDTMVAEYFVRNFLPGAIVLEGSPAISWMSVSFLAVNQQRNLYRHGGASNRVDAVSGTDSVSLTSINKTALTSGEQIALNGSLSQTLLGDPTQADISTSLSIGSRGNGASVFLNGHIAAIRYYRKRLPNAKLVQLTT
jgi:hypothetical protein